MTNFDIFTTPITVLVRKGSLVADMFEPVPLHVLCIFKRYNEVGATEERAFATQMQAGMEQLAGHALVWQHDFQLEDVTYLSAMNILPSLVLAEPGEGAEPHDGLVDLIAGKAWHISTITGLASTCELVHIAVTLGRLVIHRDLRSAD